MAQRKQENIYITWHYTTHGTAYLKHVLAAFYCGKVKVSDIQTSVVEPLDQNELNSAFDVSQNTGFLFDKVYYLTASQQSFDKISTRRFEYRKNILSDPKVINSEITDIWEQVIHLNRQENNSHLFAELDYVKEKYPDKYATFCTQVWRDIQHYPIDDQIKWFSEHSNAAKFYADRFKQIDLAIADLRDEQEITTKLATWVKQISKQHPNAQFTINVSLGTNETQVAWFILGDADYLPQHTIFIKTFDDKSSNTQDRFKLFSVTPVPIKLLSHITQQTLKVYEKAKSQKRRLVSLKLDSYLQQGFSILLLGERGTGKSIIVEEKSNGDLISVNCASFEDDAKAEAELFGYEKGAFTGADKDKKGLFYEAKNKILFLDEVHNLSKRVQAKLMQSLQTDHNNQFSIRRLGSHKIEKIECTVIFASNKSILELKEILLPDFFDRIAQLVITFPALRETPEERLQDWQAVWQQLKFSDVAPEEAELLDWLNKQSLYGNFRDLQKIAIYYKSFLGFSDELKKLIGISSAFEYARSEFEKYHVALETQNSSICFEKGKTAKQMEQCFHHKLIEWAEVNYTGDKKQIAEKLAVSEKTLSNWKAKN